MRIRTLVTVAGLLLAAAVAALSFGAGQALAAAPVVTTGSAATVTATSVTVAGAVDPSALATTWHVEYGTSLSYGSTTTSSSAGSGTTAVDVSAVLSGLTAGTTYHYRVVAVNSSGTTNGADATFLTTAPPTVVTGAASAITPTTATVSGTVDPRGRATTWVVEFGQTTSYGSTSTSRSAGSGSGALDVSSALTGLTAARTYHYRVNATSDIGTTQGADRIFATSSPPRAVTGGISALSASGATVSVTVNPNGLDTTWVVDYGTTTGYGTRTGARSAGNGTADVAATLALDSLRAGTLYHYRVVAMNAAGTTSGADATFTTSGAPDARTGPATAATAAGATLTGSIDARNRTTTWYFEYGTTTGYGVRSTTRTATTRSGDQNVSAAVTGLKPATTYHFRIVATNDAGLARGSDQTVVTAAPPVPVTGAALVASSGTVTLIGSVQTNGVATSWWFELGASSAYGTRTPTRSVAGATGASTVTEAVTAATPGGVLHYRLVVSSDAGIASGGDSSIRVGAPPTAVTGGTTGISVATAAVTGTLGTGGLATTWWFEYGRTTQYGSRTASAPTGATGDVRATFVGLPEGTTVHYRLVSSNGAGRAAGADAHFTTEALPRTPDGQLVRCTIVGTAANDVLRGTAGKDVICGLGGNDTIYGLGGDDVIYGGPGNDLVDAGYGNDVIYGGPGDDRILAGPGRDTIIASSGTDTVNGGPGLDCATVGRAKPTLVSSGVCPKRL